MKTLAELAQALRNHRKAMELGQKDMRLKIGMSQQQYQRAESGQDLRVSSLLRILEGLDLELQLIPRQPAGITETEETVSTEQKPSAWQDFLADLED